MNRLALAAALVLLATGAAHADAIYTLHGQPYDQVENGPTDPYPRNPLSYALNGWFVLAAPLSADLSFFTLPQTSIGGYFFTDGSALQISPANTISASFVVDTDSNGQIMDWDINLLGNGGSQGVVYRVLTCRDEGDCASGEGFDATVIGTVVNGVVQATYGYGLQAGGEVDFWTGSEGKVPEPSPWLTMVTGVFMLGLAKRIHA